jgi:hypothetical protein
VIATKPAGLQRSPPVIVARLLGLDITFSYCPYLVERVGADPLRAPLDCWGSLAKARDDYPGQVDTTLPGETPCEWYASVEPATVEALALYSLEWGGSL